MPKQLRLTLLLGCLFGTMWPLFNVLSIYSPPSTLQAVMFGEMAAVLYGFSDLPPYRPTAKIVASVGSLLLPVLIAMLLRR